MMMVANENRTRLIEMPVETPTMTARLRQLSDQVTELRRCAQMVRNLHEIETVKGKPTCTHCGVDAPCPTLVALKGKRS